MKLKYTFEMMEIDDQPMAVPVGDGADELHGILKLNKSAAAIIELLKEDITEDQIVEKMLERFDGDEQEIRACVHDYLAELNETGLLEQ